MKKARLWCSVVTAFAAVLMAAALPADVVVTAKAGSVPAAQRGAASTARFKAVAFDYLVLFTEFVVSEVERVFPGKGKELTDRWRTRQFEYSWLRSITGRYVDFSAVTEDALVYAANAMQLELTSNDKRQLLDSYLHLAPWPDVADALRRLQRSGIRIITIANVSPLMLRSNAEHAGLIGFFDALISTDANHTYKPDSRAYRLGVDRLHLAKHDVLFAASAGWDAAGAKSFGYPTYWVNRFDQPLEELGVRPDRTSTNLDGLLDFALSAPTGAGRGVLTTEALR